MFIVGGVEEETMGKMWRVRDRERNARSIDHGSKSYKCVTIKRVKKMEQKTILGISGKLEPGLRSSAGHRIVRTDLTLQLYTQPAPKQNWRKVANRIRSSY